MPEGLNLYSKNNLEPSFVFKTVINYLIKILKTNDVVYFAPANNFRSNFSEQVAGRIYLEKNIHPDTKIEIKTKKTQTTDYIDTLGNAILLMKQFPIIRFTATELICSKLHSKRAIFCFRRVGFIINKVHKVNYKNSNEPIVRRLWYYHYPMIHSIYEMVAYIKDKLTISYRLKGIF